MSSGPICHRDRFQLGAPTSQDFMNPQAGRPDPGPWQVFQNKSPPSWKITQQPRRHSVGNFCKSYVTLQVNLPYGEPWYPWIWSQCLFQKPKHKKNEPLKSLYPFYFLNGILLPSIISDLAPENVYDLRYKINKLSTEIISRAKVTSP